MNRTLKLLQKHTGSFISVADIAEQLNLSLNDTLDALVCLQLANLCNQTVDKGWQAK
jgi:predicted Rossmann fold nucleotide-binding protein DprA/Smf involved in DNA uptake